MPQIVMDRKHDSDEFEEEPDPKRLRSEILSFLEETDSGDGNMDSGAGALDPAGSSAEDLVWGVMRSLEEEILFPASDLSPSNSGGEVTILEEEKAYLPAKYGYELTIPGDEDKDSEPTDSGRETAVLEEETASPVKYSGKKTNLKMETYFQATGYFPGSEFSDEKPVFPALECSGSPLGYLLEASDDELGLPPHDEPGLSKPGNTIPNRLPAVLDEEWRFDDELGGFELPDFSFPGENGSGEVEGGFRNFSDQTDVADDGFIFCSGQESMPAL